VIPEHWGAETAQCGLEIITSFITGILKFIYKQPKI